MGVGDSKAKDAASFHAAKALQVDRANSSYYANEDLDGHSKMRVSGGIQSKKLDKDLLLAVAECLKDDGKISYEEAAKIIIPKIIDGRLGRKELTMNERWTIRYALGEFQWESAARFLIHDVMRSKDIIILDGSDVAIQDPKLKAEALAGPSLEALSEPAAKKPRSESDDLIEVDGMLLDRGMLQACRSGLADDGVVDALEAIKIFNEAADDGTLTRAERWTFRFLLSAHTFTDAAFNFLNEALSKMPQNDSHSA